MTGKYLALALMVPMYAFTVLIRKEIHAEPFEALWCVWVFAQGYSAAIIGYLLGRSSK
jgi:hypothetical protein